MSGNTTRAISIEQTRSDRTAAKKKSALTVLLISDDAADARLIRKALVERAGSEWRLERVRRLTYGVNRLKKEGVAAVLLDLFLPDSQGIKTFDALFEAAPLVPILVLATFRRKNSTTSVC
jgi:DNA-binding response OmpR family regulator